jgi:uncharacterized phage protein gp47/JayE
MKLTQNWIGYLDRSYEQIKNSVISRLVKNTPELTDHSESNILIVIVSLFAGIGEMINYYIDNMAREAFLGTAQKYSSVIKLVKLIDYRAKARWYPSVDLLFTSRIGNVITATTAPIFIAKGTQVSDVNGNVFTTLADRTIAVGQSGVFVPAAQYEENLNQTIGTSNGTANQQFQLPDDYVHNTMKVVIASTQWSLYTSLGQMGPATNGFIIDIDENGNCFMIFGDGVNGAIPANGENIVGSYWTTAGSRANSQPNTITTIITTVSVPVSYTLTVNNPDYAVGGTDFESIDEIRDRAPRSIRTLDRAVSYQDYIDVPLQVPGVGSAEVSWCCGKYIDLYIVPNTRGSSTIALIDVVQDYIDCRKMVGTLVSTKASGITKIWIKGKIYGKPLYTQDQIAIPSINALDDEFGFSKIQINRSFAVSDITRVLENLEQVDKVEIEQVRILPFARPLEGTNSVLNIEFLTLPVSLIKVRYTLTYNVVDNSFQVFKETALVGVIPTGTPYNDGTVNFKVNSGSYAHGSSWEFTVTPSYPEIFPSGTIELKDFTAPIVDVDPLVDENTPRGIFSDLTFITQSITSNCTPPCA